MKAPKCLPQISEGVSDEPSPSFPPVALSFPNKGTTRITLPFHGRLP